MTAAAAARSTQTMDGGVLPAPMSLPVKANTTIYQGTIVALDSTGYAVPAATSTTHYVQGVAQETVINTGANGALNVSVKAGVFLFNNSAAGDAIAQADCGHLCYIVDDNTVAKTDGGGTRSRAGVVMKVDTAGVWVALHPYGMPTGTATLTGAETLTNKTLTAPTITGLGSPVIGEAKFTANDCELTLTGANSGGCYTIGTTAADSTVSLTAGAGLAAGDYFFFLADGTKNGHTVTYRDGTTAISAAKTATKRHAVCIFYDGANFEVLGEVSP